MKHRIDLYVGCLLLFLGCSTWINAQNIIVSQGATIKVNNGSQIKLKGNWQNNGTFTPGIGNVFLNGNSGQSILNAGGNFYNLTLDNSNSAITLQSDITIDNNLTLTNGDLLLNGQVITLNPNGTLTETAGNTLTGTSGYITTSRSINAPASQNIAGLGFSITSTNDFGTTEIRRSHAAQSIHGGSSILRTFEIIPGNAGLTADVVFHYDESELNNLGESGLGLYQSIDGGTSWTFVGGTFDGNANSVIASSVNLTGLFTIAPEPPTSSLILSVSLQGRSDFSGDYTVGLYHETSFAQIQEYSLSAGTSGVFNINNLLPGTYWITIKHPQYLQNVTLQTLTEGSNTVDLGQLLAGDANNDNFITALDFSILATSFNQGPEEETYDGRADFNGDGFVTALDFSLLAVNFNSAGNNPGESLDENLEDRSKLPTIVDEVELQFSTPDAPVQLGEEFQVQLIANSRIQAIDAIVSLFQFDTKRLELVDLQMGNTLGLVLQNQVNDKGQVSLAAGTLDNFPSGKVLIATFTFRAIATGKAGLLHDWDQSYTPDATFGGQSILGETYDANITIEGPTFKATIYPVPTDGFLTLEVENPVLESGVQVHITNMNGQVVYRNIVENTSRKRLDLTKLLPGVYNIQISSGEEVVRKQFVITK